MKEKNTGFSVRKKEEKRCKKVLTKGSEGGILAKLLGRGSGRAKRTKKVLDKVKRVCYTEAPVERQRVHLVN